MDESGYIRLKQFNANASKDHAPPLLRPEIRGAGYVLDLRKQIRWSAGRQCRDRSASGLDECIIVSTRTRDGIQDVKRAQTVGVTKSPVVVLVNEGSASASEIPPVPCRDNKRGELVGQKPFGKGLVQSSAGLSDGSA